MPAALSLRLTQFPRSNMNPVWPSGGNQSNPPQWPDSSGGVWPNQANQPNAPVWPNQANQANQPNAPVWPNQANQPNAPVWPNQSNQPNAPVWPNQPNQPSQPSQPSWPNQPNQPNQPSQPSWPNQPNQPNQPSQPSWPNQPGWPTPQPPSAGGWPNPSPGAGPGVFPASPQQNLKIPYNQNIPRGVHDKLLITIVGTVNHNPYKFAVNLCASDDIAFHFNPRFDEYGSKVIVRNSFLRNSWGPEERELQHFPFIAGKKFELKILCTSSEYKVAVDNAHLLSYRHRFTNLPFINKLSIEHDVTLSSVNVQSMN